MAKDRGGFVHFDESGEHREDIPYEDAFNAIKEIARLSGYPILEDGFKKENDDASSNT